MRFRRFTNAFDSSRESGLLNALRWKLLSKNPQAAEKKEEDFKLPMRKEVESLQQQGDFICWLSHASFLIQLDGVRFLIDPVMGDIPFYRRKNPPPYTLEELGRIDVLLISHTHYDHMDAATLKRLPKQINALLPSNMGAILRRINPHIAVKELDWYEQHESGTVTVTLVPAKHWGRRGAFDKNVALWGGFVLQSAKRTLYFAGDTGYAEHFSQIAERFSIDDALLPIGAYKPELMMQHHHLSPIEAFRAFKTLHAKRLIPMHYGTFDLANEPLGEPLEWMRSIAAEHEDEIIFPASGEVVAL